jgi:pimeloyl-ACP methyl ester carboxylesterase
MPQLPFTLPLGTSMTAFCRFLLLTTILLASLLNRATAQNDTTVPPIPPPGQLIDVNGWRLHLNCTGKASPSQPTVILEAGAGGLSVDWSLVQPAVSRFARVCSYDRAGLGWSEMGPHPRTLRQVVWELHTLLKKADVRPPFVLVGHSAGGILVRLYAFTFPEEVAGIVLLESGHERGVQVLRDGKLVRLVETATGRPVPDVKTFGPLRESDIPADALAQIKEAARNMAVRANEPPRDKLPPDAQRMRDWAFAQVKHWATNNNPFEAEELANLYAKWTRTSYALGDRPLMVLSRGRMDSDNPEVEEEHRRNQAELLGLSRSARQVIAPNSRHEIMLDEPHLVIRVIREVLAAASK